MSNKQSTSDMKNKTGNKSNVNPGTMKKNGSITFIIAVFLIAALASCVRDLGGGKEKSGGDDMALVTLSLSTPASRATRAPGDPVPGSVDENQVTAVDVLLFTKNDDKLYYRASATGDNIKDEAPTPYLEKTFIVKLPINPVDGNDDAIPYRMVILANASDLLAGIAPATLVPVVTDRETLLDGLARTVTAGTKLAPPFMMWGYYTADLVITESSPSTPLSVDLTRAVARVDVSVDKTNASNFVLTSARLYNYSVSGYIAPGVDGAGYDALQWDGAKAIGARDPFPAVKVPSDGYIPYNMATDGTDTDTDGDNDSFKEIIYTFEAAAGNPVSASSSSWKTNTCLVIGGHHDGNPTETFYRVEFRSGTDPGPYTYLALLRNYIYNVVIQSVSADGWPTPGEAYANLPSNIAVDIVPWDDGTMNEVVFNGQYFLSVDKSHLDFYREGYSKSVKVTTTHPDGWSVEDLPGWLEVVAIDPDADAGTRSTLSVRVNPGPEHALSSYSREGWFYIVAGNLRKKITVTQRDEIEFWLSVTDSTGNPIPEILFGGGDEWTASPPVKQKFRVEWYPLTIASVDILEQPGGTIVYAPDSYDFSASISAPGTNGVAEFTVRPAFNTTTNTLVTRVDFSVTHDGQSKMLPLYLRQESRPTYLLDGETLTLFSHFPRGTDFDLSSIQEFDDPAVAAAVTKLVVHGDAPGLTDAQIQGIKSKVTSSLDVLDGLLSGLNSVSLPDFTGTIPAKAFSINRWLKTFEAPKATALAEEVFYNSYVITSYYFPAVETVGRFALGGGVLSQLPVIDLPVAHTFGDYVFHQGLQLPSLKLGYNGPISASANFYNSYATASNTDLYLGTYEYSQASGNSWKGITWKSISKYE